jgi:hypothetical protein
MTKVLASHADFMNAIHAVDPFQDPDFWWPVGQFDNEVEIIDLDDRMAAYV